MLIHPSKKARWRLVHLGTENTEATGPRQQGSPLQHHFGQVLIPVIAEDPQEPNQTGVQPSYPKKPCRLRIAQLPAEGSELMLARDCRWFAWLPGFFVGVDASRSSAPVCRRTEGAFGQSPVVIHKDNASAWKPWLL